MKPTQSAPSLYLDTSVIGGYYDAEFKADTRALWRLAEAGRFRFFTSRIVFDELLRAPQKVRELFQASIFQDRMLWVNEEMKTLAAAYLEQKIVPSTVANDARHVAVSSVARLDYLVSWNFKHLANVRREAGFNAVNILQGYPPVRIVSPTFLIHGHEEKGI